MLCLEFVGLVQFPTKTLIILLITNSTLSHVLPLLTLDKHLDPPTTFYYTPTIKDHKSSIKGPLGGLGPKP